MVGTSQRLTPQKVQKVLFVGAGHPLAPHNITLSTAAAHEYEAQLRQRMNAKSHAKLARFLMDEIAPAQLTCDCNNTATCHAKILTRVAQYYKDIEEMVVGMNLGDCVWYRL